MSSFIVTAPSKAVKADAQGVASMSFAVTNITSRSVRGTPGLKVREAAKAWMKLQAGGTRSFAPQETHVFIVEIKVPAGANGGELIVGLNISNEASPEEDFAEGPPVALNAAASEPIPLSPRPVRWIWIWLPAAVVVLGGAVAGWLLKPSPPDPKAALPGMWKTVEPKAAVRWPAEEVPLDGGRKELHPSVEITTFLITFFPTDANHFVVKMGTGPVRTSGEIPAKRSRD